MLAKTLEPYSIPIPPQLAGRLKQALGKTGTGFDEGAFLQQLHYWTLNAHTTGWVSDGRKWIYNSLKSWQQQFPWMTEYGLRKAIANLKKLGLIQTAQHWISQYKRVMFYRIDYDRLTNFAPDLCDLITPRYVNTDHLDVRSDHTSDPDTPSDTSLPEQQPVVVASEQGTNDCDCSRESGTVLSTCGETWVNPGEDHMTAASSGNNSVVENSVFPELVAAVAQAIRQPPNQPLPTSLKRAINQYPDRVPVAIQYLQDQQQRHPIKNPVGYLYEAISHGWEMSVSPAIVPVGFSQWFAQANAQGLILAATTINGIHHSLHVQHGWLPTAELMQDLS